jgi:hypothetical protein
MAGNSSNIVKHLFNSDSLENVSVKQLEEASNQFPFFGVSHYLLSKKLFSGKEEKFLDETKKTSLYFTNPFWLQWLLENSGDEKWNEIKKVRSEDIKKQILPHHEPALEDPKPEISLQIKTETEQMVLQNDDLLFEPYHTVDYFASQGIRFIVEENPNDTFGKQLKSFTQWLKTMKKLPIQAIEKNIGTAEQAAIDDIAAYSIQQKEIITEAMADVLAKQGKNEDAITLYRKLSLINPSKSAYFAAKIEQLNIP